MSVSAKYHELSVCSIDVNILRCETGLHITPHQMFNIYGKYIDKKSLYDMVGSTRVLLLVLPFWPPMSRNRGHPRRNEDRQFRNGWQLNFNKTKLKVERIWSSPQDYLSTTSFVGLCLSLQFKRR